MLSAGSKGPTLLLPPPLVAAPQCLRQRPLLQQRRGPVRCRAEPVRPVRAEQRIEDEEPEDEELEEDLESKRWREELLQELGWAQDVKAWAVRLQRMPPTWRAVALYQLLRIEQDGAYAGLVGGSPGADTDETEEQRGGGGGGRRGGGQGWDRGRGWESSMDNPRDARRVTDIVGGVTRWRRRLDWIANQLARRPVEEMDPPLRQIVRMGVLLQTERDAPDYTVNELVQLAKEVMHQGAAGVANFVLRELVRRRQAGTAPQPPPPSPGQSLEEAAEALGIGASHPTWLVEAWLRQFGPQETVELLRWNNLAPKYSLRLAPGLDPATVCQELAEVEVEAKPSRYLPADFITLSAGMQALLRSGRVDRGDMQVQDEAAGLVVAMLDPQPGDSVLDACAAPGGKTLYAAARMKGRGSVLALDVAHSRLAALRRTAQRQPQGAIVRTVCMDLRAFAEEKRAQRAQHAAQRAERAQQGVQQEAPAEAPAEGEQAQQAQFRRQRTRWDRLLLDAPCSGTGVLSKRADLRWRKSPSDVAQMAELQAELLDAAADLVASGGLLVYSTCSLQPEENQQQVAAFLQRHPEFRLEPPPPRAGIPPECLSPEGYLRMLPHVHHTDGAFAARLRRAKAQRGRPGDRPAAEA